MGMAAMRDQPRLRRAIGAKPHLDRSAPSGFRLSPFCRLEAVSGGAVLVDWRRVRFYGLVPADADRLGSMLARSPTSSTSEGVLVDDDLLADLGQQSLIVRPTSSPDLRVISRSLRTLRLLIAVFGFQRVLRLIDVIVPRYFRVDAPPLEFSRLLRQRIADVSQRSWLIAGDCKTAAVTAYLLARRQGFAATLHVGLREHPFSLHSWTTCGDVDIPDRDPGGYQFRPILVLRP